MLKKIGIYFFFFLIFILLGNVITYTYNFYNSNYEIKFSVNEEFDYEKLVNKDYLLTIVNSAEKYENIDVNKMIENEDIKISKIEDTYIIETGYEYYEEFFISKSKTKGTRVKQFFIDAINNLVSKEAIITYEYDSVYIIKDDINYVIVCSISGVIGLGLSIIIFRNKKEKTFIYDNEHTFKFPFKKLYWQKSVHFLDTTKKIVNIAMLFSLMMVCKIFSLPSGFSNLGISLTYLFFALIALIYGPIGGLTIGLFSDILGYFLFDRTGVTFYFGYTIQAMLAGFIYGLFLYRTRITFLRCFLARMVVNLLLNVIVGSLCFGDIMNFDYETIKMYALVIALPKNLVYLVPQSILLFIFIKFISPYLYHNKYIHKSTYENIEII